MKDKNRYAKNICILVLGIVSLVLLCLLAKITTCFSCRKLIPRFYSLWWNTQMNV